MEIRRKRAPLTSLKRGRVRSKGRGDERGESWAPVKSKLTSRLKRREILTKDNTLEEYASTGSLSVYAPHQSLLHIQRPPTVQMVQRARARALLREEEKSLIEREKKEDLRRQKEIEKKRKHLQSQIIEDERMKRVEDARKWRREVEAQKRAEKAAKEKRRIEEARKRKMGLREIQQRARRDIYDFVDSKREKLRMAKAIKLKRLKGVGGRVAKQRAASQIQRAFSKWSRSGKRDRSKNKSTGVAHDASSGGDAQRFQSVQTVSGVLQDASHSSPYEQETLALQGGEESVEDYAWRVVMASQFNSDDLPHNIAPMTPADLHFQGTAVEDAFPLPPLDNIATHSRNLVVPTPNTTHFAEEMRVSSQASMGIERNAGSTLADGWMLGATIGGLPSRGNGYSRGHSRGQSRGQSRKSYRNGLKPLPSPDENGPGFLEKPWTPYDRSTLASPNVDGFGVHKDAPDNESEDAKRADFRLPKYPLFNDESQQLRPMAIARGQSAGRPNTQQRFRSIIEEYSVLSQKVNAEIARAQEKAKTSGGMPGLSAYSRLEDTQRQIGVLGKQIREIPGALQMEKIRSKNQTIVASEIEVRDLHYNVSKENGKRMIQDFGTGDKARVVDTPIKQAYSETFVSPYTGTRTKPAARVGHLGNSADDIETWYEREMEALRQWKPREFSNKASGRQFVRENGIIP